jgi:uncharacterized membrane protein
LLEQFDYVVVLQVRKGKNFVLNILICFLVASAFGSLAREELASYFHPKNRGI